jgi:ketosteroid isomerase-like protein
MNKRAISGLLMMAIGLAAFSARASADDARQLVAKLDVEYQAAVKLNDVKTMERILHKDMILVLGNGTTETRDELIKEARDKSITFEQQDEDPGTQTVRVWGDTAVVTARLWVKGVNNGHAFNRHLWFSVHPLAGRGWLGCTP